MRERSYRNDPVYDLVFGTWKRACGTNHRTFTFCFVWILAEPLRWSPCGFKDTDKRKRKPVTSGFSGGGFCTTVSRAFHWSSRDCRTSIAPLIRHKTVDSPVLVLDEAGQFVIPVLSGHLGGANELAQQIAESLHSAAVVTTATDVNGLLPLMCLQEKWPAGV